MTSRRMLALLSVGILALLTPFPAMAQLTGTDTAPGSSCAGFPQGATRITADADLDGAEVTLVCDGTTWNAVSGGGGIPLIASMAAPSWGPSCTQRTTVLNNATVTRSCNAGEIMTGGGCSATANNLRTSNPSAAATWQCIWTGANANNTAYAVCCTF